MLSAVTFCAVLVAPAAPPESDAPHVSAPWLGLSRSREGSDQLDLEPVPGGGFQYEDDEGGFRATILPDGSVHFDPINRSELKGTPKQASTWFEGFVDAVQKPPGERGRPPPSKDGRSFVNQYAAQGMQTVNWGPYGPGPVLFGIGGGFGGFTQASRGPSEKAKREFLDKTETMRDGMAVRFRKEELERAARQITADVVTIWKDRSTPLFIRKRRVFELWDDAEPPPGDEGPISAALAKGSQEVRTRIERAIRMLAPKGSDDAYTDDELDEFNATRTGKRRFDPYKKSHKSTKRHR